MTSMAGMPPAETTILLTSTILRGVNNCVLYCCDAHCNRIVAILTTNDRLGGLAIEAVANLSPCGQGEALCASP